MPHRVLPEFRFGRAIRDNRQRGVPLVHLHAIPATKPDQRGIHRGAQPGPAAGGFGTGLLERGNRGQHVRFGRCGWNAHRREHRRQRGQAFKRAIDNLPRHRRPFGIIRFEQTGTCRSFDHRGQLPRQIISILHRCVQPQPAHRRVAVHRVAHAKHPADRIAGGVLLVDGPGRHGIDGDRNGVRTDQLLHDSSCLRSARLGRAAG